LMVGVVPGDTRETAATISAGAEYEAVRGQIVSVSIQVHDVRQLELPKLNQAFLDAIGGFEDEDELREAVRGELERQAGFAQKRRLREQITAALIRGAEWELPPALVRRQAKRELDRMVLELQSSGFSAEMIQNYANQIRQNSLRATEAALKEHFIFERIAEDEKIEAEPTDYDVEIKLIADQSGDSVRRVRSRLEKRGQMDALRNQIIERKVVDLICSKAQFEDVPLEERPDDTCAVDLTLAGGHDTSEIPEAKHGGEAEELREPTDRP
jgi:trigger factor